MNNSYTQEQLEKWLADKCHVDTAFSMCFKEALQKMENSLVRDAAFKVEIHIDPDASRVEMYLMKEQVKTCLLFWDEGLISKTSEQSVPTEPNNT